MKNSKYSRINGTENKKAPFVLTHEYADKIALKAPKKCESSEIAKSCAELMKDFYVCMFGLNKDWFSTTNAFGSITLWYHDLNNKDEDGLPDCYQFDSYDYVPTKEEAKFINQSIIRLLHDIKNA